MLVLSRKNGQKIIINDDIEITILESKFDNCKIAINAPSDIKIYREEVYRQIQQSNKLSHKNSAESIDSLLSLVDEVKAENKQKENKVILKKKED